MPSRRCPPDRAAERTAKVASDRTATRAAVLCTSRLAARCFLGGVLFGLTLEIAACDKGTAASPGAENGGQSIAVITSGANPLFDRTMSGFTDQTSAAIHTYRLTEKNGDEIANEVSRSRPQLVFCLGSSATRLATRRFPELPVLFSMVVNYRRQGITPSPSLSGISLEPPALAELTQFKMVLPGLRRLLVFYAPVQSAALISDAVASARQLGITLKAVPVETADAVESLFENASRDVDAVWMPADPVVATSRTFEFLRKSALDKRLPLLCSLSQAFARAGALMAVSVDLPTLGAQAAVMAGQVLAGGVLGPVQPPISTHLTVNLKVARQLGVRLPEDALPYIDVLLTDESAGQPRP